MGIDNNSRHAEYLRQLGEQNADSHSPAYGIDRYAYNQGENGQFAFSILENIEPSIVARGGGGGSRSETWKLYQEKVGALCATDYKWVQQEQVVQDKLIIQRRTP